MARHRALGFTGLGAAIGVGVNAATPSMPIRATQVTETTLIQTLVEQLDDLADGLLQDPLLTPQRWGERQRAIEPQMEQLRTAVEELSEAHRINWRAHRWVGATEREYGQARALQRLAFMVEDITSLLVDREHADSEKAALGPSLRPRAASVLRQMASVLRSVDGPCATVESLRAADVATQDFAAAIRETRERTGDDLFAAATIVTAVRRALATLVPEDLASELPTEY